MAKIEIENPNIFKPIKVSITIETQKELNSLVAISYRDKGFLAPHINANMQSFISDKESLNNIFDPISEGLKKFYQDV